jgi:hypothetical protein
MAHPKGGCAGNIGDCKVQVILEPYMDPSYEGSQSSMAKNAVLRDQGGSGVDHQIFPYTVATSNNKTRHQDRNDAVF